MSRIHVTIDRLVLPGIDPADRHALVEGLQRELGRVLSEPRAAAEWARSQRTPALRLGPITLEKGASGGRKFGITMARAIGKGLKP